MIDIDNRRWRFLGAFALIVMSFACLHTSVRAATGTVSVQNQQTDLCMDNTGGSSTPLNKVTRWRYANNANQNWQFLDRGNGRYTLRNQASGSLVLDDPGGSTTRGTALQIYTDNGLAPQQWVLQ